MAKDVNEIGFEDLEELLPKDIFELLEKRDSAALLLDRLPQVWTPKEVAPQVGEQKTVPLRLWELIGLTFYNKNRPFEALAVFSLLYQHMLRAQIEHNYRTHKGMPLLWISECFYAAGFILHTKRYLMLTLAEDALTSTGKINPDRTGTYFRLVWRHGLSGIEFDRYADEFKNLAAQAPIESCFPEWLLQEIDQDWMTEFPTLAESAKYFITEGYVHFLIDQLGDPSGKILERLATYLLSAIPGFRATSRRKSRSTDYDVVCTVEGLEVDFRAELVPFQLSNQDKKCYHLCSHRRSIAMPKRIKLRRFRCGEKKMLFTKIHDRKLPVWIAQRYRIIANVYQEQSVRATARQLGCAKETAYRCVKEFNQHGFRRFDHCSNPEGRPTQISQRQMDLLLCTAQKRPTDVGLPFTNWSMNTLQEYLVKRKNFPKVSPEWLRCLLHRGKVSWQHTKTWKQSHDPDFTAKKSVFWRFMHNARSVGRWFAMISWVHLNSGQSPECVGQADASQNGIAPPTHVSKVQNSCMGSMMFTPIAWWDAYANARLLKISRSALLNCAPATLSKFVSLLSWIISLPISELQRFLSRAQHGSSLCAY